MSRELKISAVFIAIMLVGFLQAVFLVWETDQVVLTKFGETVRIVAEPGLHFKIPFIYKVNRFEKRLLDYESSPTEIITQDKKTLIVDNYAKWRIDNPLKFMQALGNELGAQSRLDDIIYSELRTELGKHKFHDIISTNRSAIMEKVTLESNKKAMEYGMQVLDVRIKRADLPQENERAVFARMEAERKRIANQYRSEGEEEALKIRAETDKQAVIIMAEAEKKSQQIRGEGDAEATKIYALAYTKNVRFYSMVRKLEAYETVIDTMTVMIISPDADFFEYFWKAP